MIFVCVCVYVTQDAAISIKRWNRSELNANTHDKCARKENTTRRKTEKRENKKIMKEKERKKIGERIIIIFFE